MKKDDLSKRHVTPNGILNDISEKAEVICPTCKGKGTINDPAKRGKPMSYYDKGGNTVPQVECRNLQRRRMGNNQY